tara:strand:+ start:160 stop:339 length:180 start_codon:yes stop_codon:yes gene_type:complete
MMFATAFLKALVVLILKVLVVYRKVVPLVTGYASLLLANNVPALEAYGKEELVAEMQTV